MRLMAKKRLTGLTPEKVVRFFFRATYDSKIRTKFPRKRRRKRSVEPQVICWEREGIEQKNFRASQTKKRENVLAGDLEKVATERKSRVGPLAESSTIHG